MGLFGTGRPGTGARSWRPGPARPGSPQRGAAMARVPPGGGAWAAILWAPRLGKAGFSQQRVKKRNAVAKKHDVKIP